MKELSENEALCKAAAYCSASEHCLSEVSEKLNNWGVSPDIQQKIVSQLVRERYIDEERFCRSFINDKFRYNKWGRTKIAQYLRMKHIPGELLSSCMDVIEEQEYVKGLSELLKSRRKTTNARTDYELNGKLIRFALGRGFEMDIILRCLKLDDYDE